MLPLASAGLLPIRLKLARYLILLTLTRSFDNASSISRPSMTMSKLIATSFDKAGRRIKRDADVCAGGLVSASFTSSKLPSRLLNGRDGRPWSKQSDTNQHQQASAPSFSCHPALRAVRKKHVGDYCLCLESNIATCACPGAADATCRQTTNGLGVERREHGLLIRLFSPQGLELVFRLWLGGWVGEREDGNIRTVGCQKYENDLNNSTLAASISPIDGLNPATPG
ncbi:uncharacterized protein TRIVIDRAFT_63109 [Trichoderma virens Gv29-8]|uniref:Uncharacterized protein n=1 Tax=Hypocrea virens (strain Gv29-8 / FGSC 10586) TaxID=413071 RepID=G9ME53_HYPVG|nr:uncharacterized protein TRIVIDRAFT_63109 [Trichoderma virens Gv29-8]EHK27348.1 hypothetical protein TRIVIDRAFT_63109 [Trichoderma virens Gv29-8]UKZ57810.1 hypothetical protein TrVGV298_011671 [Trichoderma virens]